MIKPFNSEIDGNACISEYNAYYVTDENDRPYDVHIFLKKNGNRNEYVCINNDGDIDYDIIEEDTQFFDYFDEDHHFYAIDKDSIHVDVSFSFLNDR